MIKNLARIISVICITGTLFFIPHLALADTSSKIAVVDAKISIFGSKTAQKYLKAFEESSDFINLQAKYESAIADLKVMTKEAESQSLTWSAEQMAEHQKKVSYIKADAELAMKKLTSEHKEIEQRILQKLAPLVEESIQEIVKEQNITLLLRAESVLFAASQESITQMVAERIDNKTQQSAE
jgi:outer membrane protein